MAQFRKSDSEISCAQYGGSPCTSDNTIGWETASKATRAIVRFGYSDVNRYASTELKEAIDQFSQTVRDAVEETQKEGRAQDVPLNVLTVFTNAVPTGAALMLTDPLLHHDVESEGELDRLIEQIIELVVPVAGINK